MLLPAALLLAILCVLAARGAASAPAEDLEEKFEDAQGKLAHVRKSESALSASIAEQNREIDSMIGEVSALRQHQAAVAGELAEKQGELEAATKELEADKRRLARIRARLHRALGVLRERLVAIYESGSPDMINVVLDSSSWSELSARADYLNQIREYDNVVAGRVKGLRDQAKAAVKRMAEERAKVKEARDAIAVKEREVERGEGLRRGALRRTEGSPGGAPGPARRTRVAVAGAQRQPLVDLRTALRLRRSGARHDPGAADPGGERRLHLRKPGEHPVGGSAGGRGGDRSGQLDRDHALHLGRRPRLLRILRL